MSITSPAERRSHAVSPESIMTMIVGGSVFPASNRPEKCKRVKLVRRASRGARPLLGAEQAIARVAEARDDVALLVQALVDARRVDRHVGVARVEGLQALGAGQEADELDRARRRLLQPIDRG